MKKRERIVNFIIVLILTALLVVVIFPLIYTAASSFKTNAEIVAHPERILPTEVTFQNYYEAWTSEVFNFRTMVWNSTYYTLISMMFALISSAVGGYVFARGEFRLKKIILACFSLSMFFSMGSVTIYPMFDILNFLHIPKSLTGLLIIKLFGVSIINIYLVRSYVYSLPKDMDEAAEIDGCNFVGIFFRIILPLLKPIMATIGILAFQGSWNDYLMPMIFTLSDPDRRPLIVGLVALSGSGEAAANYNIMFAGTTIALLPVLIAYAVGNKYFVSGLASGAVKG